MNKILQDVYQSLAAKLKDADGDSIEGTFAMWMYSRLNLSAKLDPVADFDVTNYTLVARLALLIEIEPDGYVDYFPKLEEGLRRVAGRSITLLNSEPAPFQSDVIALLALGIGGKRIGGDVQQIVREWLCSFVNPQNKSLPSWKRIFLYSSLFCIGARVDERDVIDINDCGHLQVALASKIVNCFIDTDPELAYSTIMHASTEEPPEIVVTACRLQAYDHLLDRSPAIYIKKPTISEIIKFLNNIPAALKRWPWEEKPKTSTGSAQKWDLQNEYHVQSFIYALLAPIFTDIEHEFYFEPTGQLNSRADIGIPSLNLIIEIKFLRPKGSFAKVIEEVAADASLYFKKDSLFTKKYSQMIILLWDDSARSQEHHEFKKGVVQLPNVQGAVVISRPGNMPIYVK